MATRLAEELMADGIRDVVGRVIEAAKDGDMRACALILDRLVPIRRGRPVEIDLPKIAAPADVLAAQSRIVEALARGEITPEEAGLIADVLDAKRKAIETVDLEARIAALEAKETPR